MSVTSPVFVAWTTRSGRANEIAHVLDGEALAVFPQRLRRRTLVLLRYLVSAVSTWQMLSRRKPKAVIVTHPPVVAALVVTLWCAFSKSRFVIDAHPTAFGAKGHVVSQVALPLHRWMARRSAGVMVASPTWARIVESWGAKPLVVHEAPAFDLIEPPNNATPVIVFPGIFGSDEPVAELLDAARQCPDFEFKIFGDTTRAQAEVLVSASKNVTFTGWLDSKAYARELQESDVVVALTTEPGSVMRAACEAVFMGRPVVVSDSPDLREAFPDAIFTANTPDGLVESITKAVGDLDRLNATASSSRQFRIDSWRSQLAALRRALDE